MELVQTFEEVLGGLGARAAEDAEATGRRLPEPSTWNRPGCGRRRKALYLEPTRLREETKAPANEPAAYVMERAETLRAQGDRISAASLVRRYLQT